MEVIVDDLATEYRDEGTGPVVLMLHGWGNTLQYFDELAAQLHGLRMVRLDLPGFGQSETPRDVWSVESYAQFVARFCEKIGIVPDLLVGHSLGGRIVTKAVSRGILNPRKMVLIASAGVAKRKTPRNLLYAAIAKAGKVILMPFPRTWYLSARSFLYRQTGSDYLTTGALSKTFQRVILEDLSADASHIGLPALIVWGERDLITPLAEGKKLHALIKNSQLLVVPHAGHFVHREYPQEVARAIEAFI